MEALFSRLITTLCIWLYCYSITFPRSPSHKWNIYRIIDYLCYRLFISVRVLCHQSRCDSSLHIAIKFKFSFSAVNSWQLLGDEFFLYDHSRCSYEFSSYVNLFYKRFSSSWYENCLHVFVKCKWHEMERERERLSLFRPYTFKWHHSGN